MVIFAFFITVSLIFNVVSLVKRSENDIKVYGERARQKVKNNLKNYVQIAYSVVETNYNNATEYDKLEKFYGNRLNNYIDIVQEIIDEKKQKVKTGKLSLKEAQKQALYTINNLRYNDGAGYIWVMTNDTVAPTMIIEPIMPELNGKILLEDRFNDSNGSSKNLFLQCVEECNDSTKDGYVAYPWIKMSSLHSDSVSHQRKFSYVRLIEDWNWILGTGIYLDETINDAAEKSISDLRTILYYDGSGYFWINNDERPTPRLIMNPKFLDGEGKISTGKKLNRAFGKDKNLYEAFLEESMKGDGGFVWYKWDKPSAKEGTKYDVHKESYVKYFKNLGWVIGSGLYTDDIDEEIDIRTKEMEEVKSSTIVNYLIISIIIAALSIAVLIYMMNKHFKKNGESVVDNVTKKNNREKDLLKKYEKDITPHVNATKKTVPSPSNTNSIEEASKLIKTFMNEQTKLIAFNNALKNTDKNQSGDIKELTTEIKKMTSELMNNANDIKLIINELGNKNNKIS